MSFVKDNIIDPVTSTFFGGAESEAAGVSQEAQEQAGALLASGFEPSQQAFEDSFAKTEFGLQLLADQPAAFTPGDLPDDFELSQFAPEDQLAGSSLQKRQALSGALGEDAQREAFSQFEESPGVAFLREQGLRLAGSKAGIGGVGGDRLRELTKFGQGLALQDFENQFRRLGETQRGEELLSGRTQQERQFGAGLTQRGEFFTADQREGARRFRESQRFSADEATAARRQQAAIELGRARGLNTTQIEQIRQNILAGRANAITGAGAAEAGGITASAAGLRAGLTQLVGGVAGGFAGDTGGFSGLGAAQGAFGV